MTGKPWAAEVFPSPNYRLGLVPALLVPVRQEDPGAQGS